jgi:hypothetical protein
MPDLTVVYESGVFKPTTQIDFEEGQILQIQILTPETLEQARPPLISRGAITMPNRNRPTSLLETPLYLSPPSDLESYGISPTSQNLLSDIIIEDRGPL